MSLEENCAATFPFLVSNFPTTNCLKAWPSILFLKEGGKVVSKIERIESKGRPEYWALLR